MKWTRFVWCMPVVSIIFIIGASPVWPQGATFTPSPGFRTQARRIAPVLPCLKDFKSMDKNNDGKVTKEEFMSVPHPGENAEALFESLDTSRAGYLTIKEYCVAPVRQCMEDFRAMDKNHDGGVSKEEFLAAANPGQDANAIFESLDRNGDGYLTKDEYCFYSE